MRLRLVIIYLEANSYCANSFSQSRIAICRRSKVASLGRLTLQYSLCKFRSRAEKPSSQSCLNASCLLI